MPPRPLPPPRPRYPRYPPSTLPWPNVSMFFRCSSPRHSRPPGFWPPFSALSLDSLEMLSKNDRDLLYASAGTAVLVLSLAPSRDPLGASPSGEPAMASLTRSSLLNFALADSKSKSAAGTSTLPGRPPRPRPPRVAEPPALAAAFTRISFTFLVRLSIGLPLGCCCCCCCCVGGGVCC